MRRIVVLLVAFAVVVGSTATARSQGAANPGGLRDGTYSGGIYFKMGSLLDMQGIIGMTNSVDAAGDATIVIDTDAPSLSGTWDLNGKGAMGGSGTYQGQTVTFSGKSDFTGSGTFSGTPLDGRLKGTSNSEGQWTMGGSGGFSFGPFPYGGPRSLDEPLTNLLNECSQLLGKWDSALEDKIEAEYRAQGADLSITRLVAYFVLSDSGLTAEESWMADRLRDLATRGNSILGDARAGSRGPRPAEGSAVGIVYVEAVKLLRDVEALQADVAALESDCPASKAFQNILTLIAQDGLDATLSYFEADPTIELSAETLRDMVRLGDGTGATGAGAKDTDRAVDLDGRMEIQANEGFDKAIQSYRDGNEATLNEAVPLAALGEQRGWSLEESAGVTGTDVIGLTGN